VPPDFSDLREIEAHFFLLPQNGEPFGERLHHPVLDPVVDHLHVVAGAGRSAVQVATLRGERPHRRLESLEDLALATDHGAEADLQPPDAAADAHVQELEAPGFELSGARLRVVEVAVAGVNEHVAGIAVRNPATVAFGRHYGLTIATCVPADPASKGGSESSVRVAKADLVPTDANLLPAYGSFAELEAACAGFTEQVNARAHRITRRAPVEMLTEEQARLHPLPATPFTATFGVTRTVADNTPMVNFEHCQYSVPHRLVGETVWVRRHGEQIVIVHVGPGGPVEVARQATTSETIDQWVVKHSPRRKDTAAYASLSHLHLSKSKSRLTETRQRTS